MPDSFVIWKAGAFAAVFLRGKSFRLKRRRKNGGNGMGGRIGPGCERE
ncbi:hypothetical protein B4135_1312 [Caldibacillus debilis]|uniref:Uncharacterized protein n=1 Tax=Caldibacillus debilis TaxID=301148 RepID=A0A150MDD0_9BACI|nr:hypothetical protein B4135_1312 [Caldibacillus debilis]